MAENMILVHYTSQKATVEPHVLFTELFTFPIHFLFSFFFKQETATLSKYSVSMLGSGEREVWNQGVNVKQSKLKQHSFNFQKSWTTPYTAANFSKDKPSCILEMSFHGQSAAKTFKEIFEVKNSDCVFSVYLFSITLATLYSTTTQHGKWKLCFSLLFPQFIFWLVRI